MKWLCVCLFALTASHVVARTATRQESVSTHITSLNDKDAKRKAMEHPAFANAGKKAGTEIWRIENFDPVPVPAKDFGKFYKGDSYIILKTSADKRNNLSWDIHYWLGSGTSQDEAGAAAILTVGLDDKFGGAAVQHRETQGHESSQFLGLFKPAIRYLDGGHQSGFSHVTTNAGADIRLFQIKGKRNVRVRQIEPSVSSMNKGDCFILDKDQNIYVYVGEKAKNVERLKAISVANQIRDQDHNGRGRVEIIDAYSSEADVEKFFNALGSGSRQAVPDESAGGDDQAFERNEEQTVTLSEISDASGKLKVTPLPKPYKQEQLKPQECYILDTVTGSIYVWVGKQSTEKEKTEAMAKAQQYLQAKKYPSWVHVSRIPQGTEPAAFKQYFSTWRDVGMTHNRLVRSISDEEYFSEDAEKAERRARIIAKTGAGREFMPDQADGDFVVYRVDNSNLEKMYDSSAPGTEPGKRFGELFHGDSYVIEYKYDNNGQPGTIIYNWLGKDLSKGEQKMDALNKPEYKKAVLVRIPQGKEPKHFLKLFKGSLRTYLGGKSSDYQRANQQGNYDSNGVRLFRIHGTEAGVDLRAEQVPEKADYLHADDVYLLETPEKAYVWIGEGASDAEKEQAKQFVHKVLGEDKTFETVNQGEETQEFWQSLSSEAPIAVRPAGKWRNKLGRRIGMEPRLFEIEPISKHDYNFQEMHKIKQSELQQDEVYLLESGDFLYLWVGQDTDLDTSHYDVIKAYNKKFGVYPGVAIIKQGSEPDRFKQFFKSWDPDMWDNHDSYYAQKKAEAIANNEI